jgi:hypothetical protein
MALIVSLVRLRVVVAAAILGAWLLPVAASAQNPPLAEVARKEQERRKTAKSAGKVLTNKDLPQTAQPAPGALPEAVPQPQEDQAAQGQKAAEPEKDKDKEEAYWRGRIGTARETLRRDQMFAETLQSRINGLTTDFVNRDDPYQRARIGEDRQKALAELERVKADIAQHTKEIADIEEEARKAGVPPGWLR